MNQAKGTALHEAAAIAALPIVEALVAAKANVNAANDKGCGPRPCLGDRGAGMLPASGTGDARLCSRGVQGVRPRPI